VLIPLRDSDGHIRVCRLLDAEGRSTDIGNPAASPGLHHIIGRGPLTPESKTVVIATDPEAAAALHTATGVPVVLAAGRTICPTWPDWSATVPPWPS
jgi:hypothetical protein